MECGKLTAKLRDAVPVIFIEEGREPKRFKNIEIPDELKEIEYKDFKFDVPENGQITFKIWFESGKLPEVWPEARERRHREKTPVITTAPVIEREPIATPEEPQEPTEDDAAAVDDPGTMEVDFNVTGDRRKELVAALGAYLDTKPVYLAMPTMGFRIGDYMVSKTGVLTGPDNPKIIDMLESHGFEIE